MPSLTTPLPGRRLARATSGCGRHLIHGCGPWVMAHPSERASRGAGVRVSTGNSATRRWVARSVRSHSAASQQGRQGEQLRLHRDGWPPRTPPGCPPRRQSDRVAPSAFTVMTRTQPGRARSAGRQPAASSRLASSPASRTEPGAPRRWRPRPPASRAGPSSISQHLPVGIEVGPAAIVGGEHRHGHPFDDLVTRTDGPMPLDPGLSTHGSASIRAPPRSMSRSVSGSAGRSIGGGHDHGGRRWRLPGPPR